jgi:hypothetical protein
VERHEQADVVASAMQERSVRRDVRQPPVLAEQRDLMATMQMR